MIRFALPSLSFPAAASSEAFFLVDTRAIFIIHKETITKEYGVIIKKLLDKHKFDHDDYRKQERTDA
jgi:hypothetical protein